MKLLGLILMGIALLNFNEFAKEHEMNRTEKEAQALIVRAEVDHPIIGENHIGLQWISWDQFGKTLVKRNEKGDLMISGKQELRGDYLTIEGEVVIIDQNEFIVDGVITTKVEHIAGFDNREGSECVRSGKLRFVKKEGRKYFRLSEVKNPCDDVTDYIDIFVSKS